MRTAGGSAGQRFKTLAKAWRRRALRPVFLACSGLVIGFAIAGTVVTGQAKFWLGALAGGTMALYMALRESPPWHIEKWRAGEEGERRTAKALRQLPGREWKAWHDLPGKNGTNVDHVVLGPAGLFLLDSKNYSGEASIEAGELRVRWLEDPEDGWVCHGMVSRMRAASAEFKERIEAATGVRVWIQPVVVLWMPFPQGVAQLSDVFFVQGEFLADWLRKRSPHGRSFDPEKISDFLQGKATTTAPAPKREAALMHSFAAATSAPTRLLPTQPGDYTRENVGSLGEVSALHLTRDGMSIGVYPSWARAVPDAQVGDHAVVVHPDGIRDEYIVIEQTAGPAFGPPFDLAAIPTVQEGSD